MLSEDRRLLHCQKCGKTDDVTHSELLKHTRSGWPRCCGEVMGYFAESRPPVASDDTTVDEPS
jgi:hypothetical protein